MKIRYLYSACVSITSDETTILCDPWFSAAYDGAWQQYPRIDKPLPVCGPADYVFISHLHPDHYDPQFLREYLHTYPQAKVLIAKQTPALLERKLRSRGIEPLIGFHRTLGGTALHVPPNANNLDSALVVVYKDQSIVNLNDNPYDQAQVDWIKSYCSNKTNVALLPFVGAGPWPQCYAFETKEAQLVAAEKKKQQYLGLFKQYCEALKPEMAVPFAGQYWLHSENLDLNPLRGMADATECRKLYDCVWVPEDGGHSTYTIDKDCDTVTSERKEPYDYWAHVRGQLKERLYRYEEEIYVPAARLPLLKLLQSAARKAAKEFDNAPTLYIAIKCYQLPQWFYLHVGSGWVMESLETPDKVKKNGGLKPRYEVTLDARYLFGMLVRLYNANNVRIGSLAKFKVVPGEPFNERLYDLFGAWWDSLRV